MRNTAEIINNYRRGFPYKELTMGELVEVTPDLIDELALQYDIKKSNYGITDEEFRSYCLELSFSRDEYWLLESQKIYNDSGRCFMFVLLTTIFISLIVLMVSVYFLVLLIIIIGWLVYKFLYPIFNESYCDYQINKFLAKKGITRNEKVEEYINEVMFQAYARNKNAHER